MSSIDNSKSKEEYDVTIRSQILEKVCEWYRERKDRRNNDFTFDNKIFNRPLSQGGFGLDLEQASIDRELDRIEKSGKLQSLARNKFRLTVAGKKYCEMIGP